MRVFKANDVVVVTGADGFIGSHLVEKLAEYPIKIRALSQYNSFNNWGWLEDLRHLKNVEVVSGDIRDSAFCVELVRDASYVFHLAALIAIPYSYIAPQSYVDTNVLGTLNICQAALKAGVKKIIHTSTSEVYGSARTVPISETHPLQPQSPYSASKIAADAMAMSFHYSFDLPLVIARPFNTFGPRQSARAVIPTIISQIAAGKKEIDLGDLRPTRDFNFVDDTCRGFIQLAHCAQAVGKTVNIGSGKEHTIRETFDLINKIMGSDAKIKEDLQRVRPVNSEVQRLLCDNRLIKQLTGYEPQFSFAEGLQKTVAWFSASENLKKYKTEIYNV